MAKGNRVDRADPAESPRKARNTRPKPVVLELAESQVAAIVQAAAGAGAISALLAGVDNLQASLSRQMPALNDRRLSRSLLTGLLLLTHIPPAPGIAISELKRVTGTTNSTAHRYATTLVAAGLVTQDPRTRKYMRADADGGPS
jgi:hypothetical protein